MIVQLEWLDGGPVPGECVVCGRATDKRYFGLPCCCPYDDHGYVVCRCKWKLGTLIEREREFASVAGQLELAHERGD